MLGRQIVEGLAEAGARVIMASRNRADLSAAAEQFHRRGHDVAALALDQGSEHSVNELLARVVEQFGGADILVNNAVLRPMKSWNDPVESFETSMRVNATGVFMMTRAFGNHMAQRGKGSIINIASIQGLVGPDLSLYEGLNMGAPPDYFVHKGGMVQLTRYAAAELGQRGVRVNCVCPGGFLEKASDEFRLRYNARTMLGRAVADSDLKGVMVFLASDASAYVTAAVIPVDGGYTAK
jgi:NAD(P)-dependent dehydrogenase (short-subunit alcohol dehydrogenase family)